MKKAIKASSIAILFLAVIPALAGTAIMTLWNGIVAATCGFATIGFWQGVGLFFLGQILTGGFVLGLFMTGGAIHAAIRRHDGWGHHWHDMTDEQRREFIKRRRKEHFGFHNRAHTSENAAD